jgi:hypothetical protein
MFSYAHRISGLRHWQSLSSKTIKEKSIVICDMTDFSNSLNPLEISSRFVKIENCHRDFVFYNINPFNFPYIKILYLKSHPYGNEYIKFWDKYAPESFRGYIDPKYKHFLSSDIKRWSVAQKEM